VTVYAVEWSREARKALADLDRSSARRVAAACAALAGDPRPPGCLKMTGTADLWRIRVGQHRVVYTVEDRRLLVLVLRVGHRREVYR
jgi:mRNA interferase RelE/StbE